jgi:hypothetical protein
MLHSADHSHIVIDSNVPPIDVCIEHNYCETWITRRHKSNQRTLTSPARPLSNEDCTRLLKKVVHGNFFKSPLNEGVQRIRSRNLAPTLKPQQIFMYFNNNTGAESQSSLRDFHEQNCGVLYNRNINAMPITFISNKYLASSSSPPNAAWAIVAIFSPMTPLINLALESLSQVVHATSPGP